MSFVQYLNHKLCNRAWPVSLITNMNDGLRSLNIWLLDSLYNGLCSCIAGSSGPFVLYLKLNRWYIGTPLTNKSNLLYYLLTK